MSKRKAHPSAIIPEALRRQMADSPLSVQAAIQVHLADFMMARYGVTDERVARLMADAARPVLEAFCVS